MLMNDRWRIPIIAPRKPTKGRLAFLPATPRQVQARLKREAYQPFRSVMHQMLAHACDLDLGKDILSEAERALALKALSLAYWLDGRRTHLPRIRRALGAIGRGDWGNWLSEAVQDYVTAADFLRAAGALADRDLADLRERLAGRVSEAVIAAPQVPQNNWRIETDCSTAAAALFFWNDGGKWPVDEWLAAAMDGLNRMFFGLLSRDGAYEEGLGYSRRASIPFLRLIWAYRQACGVDLLNHPAFASWYRWNVEVQAPDGKSMPYDDTHDHRDGYPHALLVNSAFKDAAVQRWAFHRAGKICPAYALESLLVFDDRIAPRAPAWPHCRVLADSGTAIFRSGWDRKATMGLLLARPLRPFGTDQVNTAHRHDDPLNFLIHAQGRLLAIDSGYGGDYCVADRYSWYLNPEAHNIILVDGQGAPRETGYQSDQLSPNVSQSAGRVIPLCGTPRVFGAQAITSYRCVDFRRSMFFVRRRYFILIDEVESARTHEYTWLLHGSGEAVWQQNGMVWQSGPARLTVRLLLPTGMCCKFGMGKSYHTEQGQEVKHRYLRAITGGRNVLFAAVVVPESNRVEQPRIRLITRNPLTLGVRIAGAKQEDVFVWNPGARVPAEQSKRTG